MFGSPHRKLAKAIQTRGIAGTMAFAARAALHAAWSCTPTGRGRRRARKAADRDFDQRYGVDTGGIISLAELQIAGKTWKHGVRYQAIYEGEFRALMAMAGDLRARTFIDYGSGKGRALLLASEYSFARIVGVEFAPELVAICRRNLATYQNPLQLCRDIEVVHADVTEVQLPPGPLVLYFYNPFDSVIMARVVDNVRRSLLADPRPCTVLYATSDHAVLWDTILKRLVAPPDCAIFSN